MATTPGRRNSSLLSRALPERAYSLQIFLAGIARQVGNVANQRCPDSTKTNEVQDSSLQAAHVVSAEVPAI